MYKRQHQGRYYNEYDSGSERYIGLHQTVQISRGEAGDTVWAAAILIPQDSYAAYTADVQKTWVIAALGLLLALLALSFFLSRRFVRPITDSLKRFQLEEMPEPGIYSGISEVDELAEFLHARARNQRLEQGDLPPNIAELFDQFVERKDLLTEAERNILRYYIDCLLYTSSMMKQRCWALKRWQFRERRRSRSFRRRWASTFGWMC